MLLTILLLAADPAVITGRAGGMSYLFVPPNRGDRVVIAVPGSGGDVPGHLALFLRHRPDEVGVVVPWTRSNLNTLDNALNRERNLDADADGLLAILDDLERRLGTRPRVVLTGFSGGGQIVYRMIVRHPHRFVAAVAVCPNFNSLVHGYRERNGDGSLPVLILTGERDPLGTFRFGGLKMWAFIAAMLTLARRRRRRWPVVVLGLALLGNHLAGIGHQSWAAESMLRRLGYADVRREAASGRGHDAMADVVFGVERRRAEGPR